MASLDYSGFAYFGKAQYVILFVIGLCSSLLSIAGSCVILYLVIRGKRFQELYHRLLLGLSVSDLLMTSTLILQPILVPKDTGYIFAIGNSSSCSFLGFGYLFFVASYAYNFLLAIYFLATVRYQTPESTISKYMEPWGHVLAFVMPIGIGSTALYFDMLNTNPFLGVCSLFPTDHECTWQDDVACENDRAHTILNNLLDFYALGLVAIGLICTGMVYCTVKRKFATPHHHAADDNDLANFEAQRRRTRSIATQAVCYAAAYFVGLLVVLGANIVDGIYLEDSLDSLGDSGVYYGVIALIWFFFPLQGFLNCIIYIRPRLVRWKHYYEEESWFFAFQKVLSNETPPRWGEPSVSITATKGSSCRSGNTAASNKKTSPRTATVAGKNNKVAQIKQDMMGEESRNGKSKKPDGVNNLSKQQWKKTDTARNGAPSSWGKHTISQDLVSSAASGAENISLDGAKSTPSEKSSKVSISSWAMGFRSDEIESDTSAIDERSEEGDTTGQTSQRASSGLIRFVRVQPDGSLVVETAIGSSSKPSQQDLDLV